ncbi:hypothetical protein [Halostreptopolyspora alba]|uniref:Uncharacterized protein n=1 Tax=Halostreptopolyspora alba TaxID=2487137 RepID=A0A3N0E5Q9_9ACTN|nr:hypothetical protein EFW17_16835 [Nocardiopsaceae bacterium YIM 96095]
MTELYMRPRRGERLEEDMASMSVEDLKSVLRDVSAELDHALTTFLPAGARLADANEIEIPDGEPMYVASEMGEREGAPDEERAVYQRAVELTGPASTRSSAAGQAWGASDPFGEPFVVYHWAHEA